MAAEGQYGRQTAGGARSSVNLQGADAHIRLPLYSRLAVRPLCQVDKRTRRWGSPRVSMRQAQSPPSLDPSPSWASRALLVGARAKALAPGTVARNPFTVLQLALAARAARVLGGHRDRPASCFRNASSNPQSHTAVCHSALASSAAAVSCTPQFAARPWPCHQRSAAAHDRPPFILTPPAPCPSRPLSCRFSGAGQWQPARLLCSS